MLFADEPRFYADKQGIAINDDSLVLGRTMTEDHLGPGAYYTTKNDEKRYKSMFAVEVLCSVIF